MPDVRRLDEIVCMAFVRLRWMLEFSYFLFFYVFVLHFDICFPETFWKSLRIRTNTNFPENFLSSHTLKHLFNHIVLYYRDFCDTYPYVLHRVLSVWNIYTSVFALVWSLQPMCVYLGDGGATHTALLNSQRLFASSAPFLLLSLSFLWNSAVMLPHFLFFTALSFQTAPLNFTNACLHHSRCRAHKTNSTKFLKLDIIVIFFHFFTKILWNSLSSSTFPLF